MEIGKTLSMALGIFSDEDGDNGDNPKKKKTSVELSKKSERSR